MSTALLPSRLHAFTDRSELWPIDRLRQARHNPRTHSADQIQRIAASMAEFGWTNPILVDEEGQILAGHGRLLAAKELGLSEVPVLRFDYLSEAQKRAYLIADNQLALQAGWDEQLLAQEVAQLRTERFDLDLLGFDATELERLLALDPDAGEAEPAEDEVPPVPAVPVSRPGDLWLLGPHQLLCGDATVEADVDRLLDGGLADVTFTDPPYNVAYHGGTSSDRRAILNDDLGGDFGAFLQVVCRQLLRVSKGAIYIAMSSSELPTLQQAFVTSGGKWSTFIIWAKQHFTLGRADYQRQFEPILYGWPEGGGHYWSGARDQGDVWFFDRPCCNELHPTMKPVALVERAIRNSSRRGDLVLDLFGGAGSTLIAADKAGRQARLMELDPVYVDVIVQRWERYTGQHAGLAGSGQSFQDLAGERQVGSMELAG